MIFELVILIQILSYWCNTVSSSLRYLYLETKSKPTLGVPTCDTPPTVYISIGFSPRFSDTVTKPGSTGTLHILLTIPSTKRFQNNKIFNHSRNILFGRTVHYSKSPIKDFSPFCCEDTELFEKSDEIFYTTHKKEIEVIIIRNESLSYSLNREIVIVSDLILQHFLTDENKLREVTPYDGGSSLLTFEMLPSVLRQNQ